MAVPDMEELLRRRPDAAAALASGELGWERLVSELVRPESLVTAFDSLSLFLRQVLELAVFRGGSLSAEEAAREGLRDRWFGQARTELGRWGLAFPGGRGQIEVLPQLRCLVWDPGGLGPGAEFLLEAQTVDVLRPMAINMGLRGASLPNRKAEIVKAIVLQMSDPARVRALLEDAPPQARSIFDRIRKLRGHSGWSDGPGDPWSWRWHPDRATDGHWWLVGHGLALPQGHGSGQVVVPAEVELAVRGRLFPVWEVSAPAAPTAPLAEGRHPMELVAALSSILLELRAAPAPALQQGGLPKRIVKRLVTATSEDEEQVELLAALALQAGLLTEVETVPERRTSSRRNPRVIQSRQAEIRVTDLATEWEALSEPERWVSFGRAVLLGSDASMPVIGDHREESCMLNFLLQLPPGQGAEAEGLAPGLHWTYPAVFPNAAVARRQLLALGSALAWLGAGGGEPTIGLNSAGRLLAGPAAPTRSELQRTFPAAVDHCTVTADRRVVVSGPPSPNLSRFLGRIAEIESVQPARIYRMSEASLRRGLDGGLSSQEILDSFRRHCPAGLPQSVTVMIEDVASRHGRLRVGAAAAYVVSDDPAEIEALVKGRGLRPLAVRRLAPTVAVGEAKSVDQVLSLLRKAGLMPVPDIGGDAGSAPSPPPTRAGAGSKAAAAPDPAARVSNRPAVPELARLLAQSPVPAPGAVSETTGDPSSAIEVVTRAAAAHKSITLGYRSLGGQTLSVLRVSPFGVTDGTLQGFQPQVGEILKLDLQRVVWAEQTDSEVRVGWPASKLFADAEEIFDAFDGEGEDDGSDDDFDDDLFLNLLARGD